MSSSTTKSTQLTKTKSSLPAHIAEDRVVMRLLEAEHALGFAVTVDQVKLVMDAAAAQEVFAKRQALGEQVIGFAHAIKTRALARLGELLAAMPKAGPRFSTGGGSKGSKREPLPDAPPTYAELGIEKKTAMVAQQLASLPIDTREAIAQREKTLADARRESKREEVKTHLDSIEVRTAKEAQGQYDVLVIDPPWPMEKIERDVRPNQVKFDYPTMDEDALKLLGLPCAEDCHVWVWTTHRFLPMAFRLLDAWKLKYVCAFVWHKPGGFQPIGLPQYNCEFALYARKGSPVFLDTKALPVCFDAPRGDHSEKPEAFYDVVRRVTAGRRLDMFNRRALDGFDVWGKEAAQ